jgi:hypothetical protein
MPSKFATKIKRKQQPKPAMDGKSAQTASADPGTREEKQRSKRTPAADLARLPSWWDRAAVALAVVFFGLIRVRLLSFPLERDEGEYAYAGQLILHGIAPYRYCYTMKLPGTAAAYALLTAIFGQTAIGVHLGLLVVNSATAVLLFLLTRKLFGKLAGVVACAAFVFLSLEPSVFGFAAHATQFVVLPAVGGILLLLRAVEIEKRQLFFWSGMVLGLSFLMKQPGIFFVLFAAAYLCCSEWMRGLRWRELALRITVFLLGAVIPFAATCLILLQAGVFPRFWFWTFSYAREYGSIVPFSDGLQIFWDTAAGVVKPAVLIWIIAAIGTIAVIWGPKARANTIFVLGFLFFSFAAVCPGFYFRQHYFIVFLPAVALLCGVAVSRTTAMIQASAKSAWLGLIPSFLFVVALAISIAHDGAFFFRTDPVIACRDIYDHNPFPEAQQIADFIRNRAGEEDRIAVVGSEPEIYFYSHLRSATGYIYMYPLMESQPFAEQMQHEMESEIENSAPRFVILEDVHLSLLDGPDSKRDILQWSDRYVRSHYQLIGVVDLLEHETQFHWDADARTYQPRSASRVFVFQKL